MALKEILAGFVTILIGVNLLPVIADQVYIANNFDNGTTVVATNVTGASSALIDLVVVFYAIAVMVGGVALAVAGMRNAGFR